MAAELQLKINNGKYKSIIDLILYLVL